MFYKARETYRDKTAAAAATAPRMQCPNMMFKIGRFQRKFRYLLIWLILTKRRHLKCYQHIYENVYLSKHAYPGTRILHKKLINQLGTVVKYGYLGELVLAEIHIRQIDQALQAARDIVQGPLRVPAIGNNAALQCCA
jgi:hypothetical protein